MKRIFWRGISLVLSFSILLWISKKLIIALTNVWKSLFNLLMPSKGILTTPIINTIALFLFSLLCILLIGYIFGIKVGKKKLVDHLLQYSSQIPVIKSLVKFISQVIEASDSSNDKKSKLALYKAPSGKRIIGMLKPRKSYLDYGEEKVEEEVLPFFEPFPPYVFSGKLYLVETKYLYLIKNVPFESFVKFVVTAGLLFGLPKKLILKKVETNPISESKSAE